MTFLLTYVPALERCATSEITPISEMLCADASWSPEQVSAAFLRHHPGIELIACTQQP
jgi:hypothetical protein